jgi:hypothetical protein
VDEAAAAAPPQTHVLYRLHLAVDGVRVAKVDVLTLRRAGAEWRAMLAGDLDGLVSRVGRGG